jgi:hydroxypyruvate isomerase
MSFQKTFKTDRKPFLDVFFTRFAWIYSEYDFVRRHTRAEKTGSFASVVFLFVENAILVSIWRHLDTFWVKKKGKKN